MNTIYLPYSLIMFVFAFQSIFNLLFWRSFNENSSRLSLEYAVNSASDLSTEYLLSFSQETPYGNIYVDPDSVWFIYKYTMLRSLNMYSKSNIEEMEYFFSSVQIAVNDGYFMKLLTQVDIDKSFNGLSSGTEKEWVYKFSQKIPYARSPVRDTPTHGYIAELNKTNPVIPASTLTNPVVISDTMNGKNILAYYINSNKYIKYEVEGQQLKSVVGSAHSIPEIGLELLTALDYSMQWNAGSDSVYKNDGAIQIPIEITESLTSDNVTLIGPQVLVICDQFNWVGNYAMSFYTVSNTQIIENILYYCYIRNGQKYYSTKRPIGVSVEQIYTKQSQCAIKGYFPDPDNYN